MATTTPTNIHQDHQLIISNNKNKKSSTSSSSLSAKSNLYYYHDQHSQLNNTDAPQSEHEHYLTSYTKQQIKIPRDKLQHTTFHHPKKTNHMASTFSSFNPDECEANSSSYTKDYNSLNKKKYFTYDDYKKDNKEEKCDEDRDVDILTSHYYNNNRTKNDRKGKKFKR